MAGPIFIDRAKETTSTTGTGAYTLAGAVTGYQSFAGVGDGNTCQYTATDGTNWETGLGTYALSGTTLSRTTVVASSNGNAAVNWSAGLKAIWVDFPASSATQLAGIVATNGILQSNGTTVSAASTTGSGSVVLATGATISSPAAITGVPAPTNAQDAANKAYADSIASGVHPVATSKYATVTALAANTYNNGTSGVGATLTANANGALSVDGASVSASDVVLVKNESTQANNGIYSVTQVGTGGTPYILTRLTSFDAPSEMTSGATTFVSSGNTNIGSSFALLNTVSSVGTTAVVWTQISSSTAAVVVGATAVTSGTSGRVLYDNAGVLGEIANTGTGNNVLATSPTLVTPALGTPSAVVLTSATGLPLTSGVTGILPIANGGWNASTTAGGRLNFALPVYVASRTDMKALDTTKDVLAILTESSGRAGTFQWTAGNFSIQVTADTQEGIYVKATAIAAASGAWVRVIGLTEAWNPLWFGATNDGVETTAALVAMFTLGGTLSSGLCINFPGGTYLISHSAWSSFTSSEPYGHFVGQINNVDNIKITADRSTIKIVNHDITTYGGLTFLYFSNCYGIEVSGFDFDMTFTGYKDSSAFYPFCGAIYGADASQANGQNYYDLNGNINVHDCTFKIYHPMGAYAVTSHPFIIGGDPNNGFKIYSIFFAGCTNGTTYNAQSRRLVIERCTIKKGHNAYGWWDWSFNDVNYIDTVAEDYVSKKTTIAGMVIGEGLAYIRHMPFYCNDIKIRGNAFRGKPSSERLTAGFEGDATFAALDTNFVGGSFENGSCIGTNNIIIMGNGDAANSLGDYGYRCYQSGDFVFGNDIFDGHPGDTVNAYLSICILGGFKTSGGTGLATMGVSNETFGRNLQYSNPIQIENGDNTSNANRRLKQLTVEGCRCYSFATFFLSTGAGASTYNGVNLVTAHGNVIDGTYSLFGPASPSTRAIQVVGMAGDQFQSRGNVISQCYYGYFDPAAWSGTNNAVTTDNAFVGVTTQSTL